MSGKGSKPRPLSVDRKTFEDNWDRIFGQNPLDKAVEVSSYWSDDSVMEAIVLKENGAYFVEIYSEGVFVTKLTKNMSTLREAEAIAENAVAERWWLEDEYAEG